MSEQPAKPQRLELSLFPPGVYLLTAPQVAKALGVSLQKVHDLIDAGAFLVVPIGDNPNAKRESLRIKRFTVEAWYVERQFEKDGVEVPYSNLNPEILYWRGQLRARWQMVKGGRK